MTGMTVFVHSLYVRVLNVGRVEVEAALKEVREERDVCVREREKEVREEMERKVEEMVRQEQERGEVRLV